MADKRARDADVSSTVSQPVKQRRVIQEKSVSNPTSGSTSGASSVYPATPGSPPSTSGPRLQLIPEYVVVCLTLEVKLTYYVIMDLQCVCT